MDPDRALTLTEQIYDTVLDPGLLPGTLQRIGEAVGGVQECFLAQAPQEQAFNMVAPRRDPAYMRSFRDDWPYRGDPGFDQLAVGLQAAPVGRALDMRRLISLQRLADTAFYHEWWRAQGLGQTALTVRFAARNGGWGMFGVHRSAQRDDEFSPDQITLLDTVAPHLARAISVQHELACLAFERQAGAAMAAGKAVFLLDHRGGVVFANAVGEAKLARGDGFRLSHGRLTLAEPRAADALARLITACVRPSPHNGGPGGSLVLARGGRNDALQIEAIPFRGEAGGDDLGWLTLFRPAVVVVVSDRDMERRQHKDTLRRRFGLTPMESELALEMLRGDGREAVAARMGVSLATVRTHLTHIFDKTGVRRQAELVRLLARETGSFEH